MSNAPVGKTEEKLFPARQLDWDMRCGTYHDRASIRGCVAPERLKKQKEFFGKHGATSRVQILH